MKKNLFILILTFLFGLNIGTYLDISNTSKQSDIIVVLGGGKDVRTKEGLKLYHNQYSLSGKIIITGNNLYDGVSPSFYKFEFLEKHGIKGLDIIHIDNTIVTNTMEELFEVKKYLLQNNLKSVLFVSHPTHSRRIQILANVVADYDKSNIEMSFASADHTKVWNKDLYYFEFESIKLVFLETIKIFYNLAKYTLLLKFT